MKHPWAVQRLRLYTSGVDVPELGSIKDKLLRRFLTRESQKEVEKNRVMATLAMVLSNGSKEVVDEITSHWNAYVSLEHGIESNNVNERKESEKQQLLDMYSKVKTVKVSAKRDRKTNRLLVSGIKNLEKL